MKDICMVLCTPIHIDIKDGHYFAPICKNEGNISWTLMLASWVDAIWSAICTEALNFSFRGKIKYSAAGSEYYMAAIGWGLFAFNKKQGWTCWHRTGPQLHIYYYIKEIVLNFGIHISFSEWKLDETINGMPADS